MNDEFVSYLNEIGMSSTLQERVAKLHDEFIWIMPDAIERIFVTDYIHSEDGRRYENLWFLSKNYCSEMKGFISNDNGDLIRTEGRVMYIEIKKENYDFRTTSDASRLSVAVAFSGASLRAELKAARNNCEYLRIVIAEHFLPHFQ